MTILSFILGKGKTNMQKGLCFFFLLTSKCYIFNLAVQKTLLERGATGAGESWSTQNKMFLFVPSIMSSTNLLHTTFLPTFGLTKNIGKSD